MAPPVHDGAIYGKTFLAYVEQFLAPTLAAGDIAVAGDLGSHKVAGVRETIEGPVLAGSGLAGSRRCQSDTCRF